MQVTYSQNTPALQIRNFPEPLHRLLAERAKSERRTISQQASVLLTQALITSPIGDARRATLEAIRKRGKTYDFTKMPTPEELIREDRNR